MYYIIIRNGTYIGLYCCICYSLFFKNKSCKWTYTIKNFLLNELENETECSDGRSIDQLQGNKEIIYSHLKCSKLSKISIIEMTEIRLHPVGIFLVKNHFRRKNNYV